MVRWRVKFPRLRTEHVVSQTRTLRLPFLASDADALPHPIRSLRRYRGTDSLAIRSISVGMMYPLDVTVASSHLKSSWVEMAFSSD